MDTPKESASCIPAEKNSLLIAEVKKYPSLYDTSDPNYYVLVERNKAWLRVAEHCEESAESCHLRWKSLRKRYAKEKRRFPEILQGRRRPWALFPKMAFLTPATVKRRVPNKAKGKSDRNRNVTGSTGFFKQNVSDDDMLILDDNDEIVHTCKTVDVSEEDEYIYETLDDPDSALEIIKANSSSEVKQTAIRSGGAAGIPTAIQTRGPARIRRPTPKMQNSIIAKKLKQAQLTVQQTNIPSSRNRKSVLSQKVSSRKIATTKPEKTVLYQDKTTRHVATVNPNIIRFDHSVSQPSISSNSASNKREAEATASGSNRPFKVIKLKGRNPIIFSPEQLPEIQSFLKSESSPTKEPGETMKPPMIKVKSVDNLNSQNISPSLSEAGENNLDIIHSVGLMRKTAVEKPRSQEKSPQQSYSKFYSWNKPSVKSANKQQMVEKIQPDSQTKDYEIEETWNDIKEENIDDASWPLSPHIETQGMEQEPFLHTPDPVHRINTWNSMYEAKLELIAYQRKLLEDQHKKNLEYMKKEHELKMTLLKAEIDLKRKQLNIML